MSRRGRVLAVTAFVAAALGCTSREPPAPPATDGALFPIRVDDKWGYMDRAAHLVIPPQWDDAERFAEDLAAVGTRSVEVNGGVSRGRSHQGWIDRTRTGATVIPALPYRHVGVFIEGRAGVARGSAWGFIDPRGREVIPTTWTGISTFKDGLAQMESGSLFGGLRIAWIDREGRVVWQER